MLKKIQSVFFRLIVSLLSLGAVFFMVKGEILEAFAHLSRLNILFFLLALLLNWVSLAVVTYRIDKILRIQEIYLSFGRLYYLWTISFFFNMFLPSAVGGDIAKAYYIAKESGKKMASITSVLFDRFFGLMATISIGFVAYLFGRDHVDPRFGPVIFWITFIVIVIALFVMSRRFSKPAKHLLMRLAPAKLKVLFERVFEGLDLYRTRRQDFILVYFYSVLAQAMFITMVYYLAKSIQIDLPISLFFLFMPLITVISMLPSIGGLGVREAGIVYLFKSYISLDQAVALSLILDVFLYGIGCVCGILYAFKGGASIKELEQIEKTGESSL